MAEKSFGIKELNLIGASGTPSIDSPNNLNLNAVNVAISTNVSIGGTLSVTGNVSIGGTLTYEDVSNIDSVGIITARNGIDCNGDIDVDGHTNLDNVSVAGVSTFTGEIHGNSQRLGSLSGSGRFSGLFLNDGSSYYGSNKLFVSSGSGFGLQAYGDMDSYLQTNSGGGTDGNVYLKTGSSSGGYVFVNGDNGVEIHHAGTSNKKFETTSSGATVTGTLTATTFSGSGASLTSIPAANLTGTLPAISGANLTNLPADTPTNSDIQVVYTVTANGTSAYRFGGNGIVSTADNPDVYLIRGLKYRFINNSGGSHPFQIRQSSGGSAYSSGVTNNGAASGNIDFQVPYSAPSHLYYQCTAHGGMVGNLYIRGAGGQNTNVGVTTFSGASTFTGISDHSSRIQMLAGNAIRFLNAANSASTEIKCDGGARLHITSYNQTMATFEQGSSIAFYTNNGQNRLQIANDGNVTIAKDLDVDGHTNLDNVSIAGITTIASGSYFNSVSPYRIANHPVLGYDNFTDISGGSYATRLGSTGTSTLRSTQIYGGGNHIATFDGVNYRLGIKTTTPIGTLDVYDGTFVLSKPNASGNERNWRFVNNNVAAGNLGLQVSTAAGGSTFSNLIEITRTGRVGINEGSPDYMLHLSGSVPAICFEDTDGTHGQAIIEQNGDNLKIRQDAGNASSGTASNIRFETDGTERLRIHGAQLRHGSANVLAGGLDDVRIRNSSSYKGFVLRGTGGSGGMANYDEYCFLFNRMGSDGNIITFNAQGSQEGSISVSGSSVAYNGGVLSRWSQLVGISTNNKSDRPTIYQGTVMSNLDEMCEWPGEENMQLNKTEVSTASGDKNVAGVFWAWDDDDDTYVNDFYIAQTGDYIIRVGAATTVTRGDLLESAGDGTAKPQSDDIVRSKTVAKVTSGIAHTTYPDGTKTYPCVLMGS